MAAEYRHQPADGAVGEDEESECPGGVGEGSRDHGEDSVDEE